MAYHYPFSLFICGVCMTYIEDFELDWEGLYLIGNIKIYHDPGRTYGPVELCYPEELELEDFEIYQVFHGTNFNEELPSEAVKALNNDSEFCNNLISILIADILGG
jgi:hypothetical protein